MRTVRRLLYAEIVKAIVFVAIGFLSLFFFFDFVSELAKANEAGYTPLDGALYSLLQLPGHLYELAPIAILIGAIYALASLAQSSEFTITRTVLATQKVSHTENRNVSTPPSVIVMRPKPTECVSTAATASRIGR